MKKKISLRKKYVRTDAWRGYEQPVNAICGANDTGSYSDSPCPTSVNMAELGMAKAVLRKNKIAFVSTTCASSNVFCVHRYLCVHPDDRARAHALLSPLVKETRLLYVENVNL